MLAGTFLSQGCPAVCESGARYRSAATRIFASTYTPGRALRRAAQAVAKRCPLGAGRVHALGDFEDGRARKELAAALPGGLELRQRFEWYACRGAAFHNDAHYADVLFGAWCVDGPPREIVFPRCALRAPAAVGEFVVFDPFEPHAVLDPGCTTYTQESYAGSNANVFVGFEIVIDATAEELFGIRQLAHDEHRPGQILLSSRIPINAETGAIA